MWFGCLALALLAPADADLTAHPSAPELPAPSPEDAGERSTPDGTGGDDGWIDMAQLDDTLGPVEDLAGADDLAPPISSSSSPTPSGPAGRDVTVIKARAPAASAAVFRFERPDLETVNRKSAADLLRRTPGLTLVQHGSEGKGEQLFLRGFDAAHGSDVEMRLHGIPLNEPVNVHGHGYLDLAFLPVELVERVVVEKGAFRLHQGPFATAGTATFELGAPSPGAFLRSEIGSTGRGRVSAVLGTAGGSFAAVEAMTDRGFGQNRSAQRLSALGEARLAHGSLLEVAAGASLYGAHFGLPGVVRLDDVEAGRLRPTDSYTPTLRGQSARALAWLRASADVGAAHVRGTGWVGLRHLLLDENFTGDVRFEGPGDRHRQRHDAASGGASLVAEARLLPRLRLHALGEVNAHAFDQAVEALDRRGAPWGQATTTGLHQALASGLGLAWTPTGFFRVEASARVDAFQVLASPRGDEGAALWPEAAAAAVLSPRLTASLKPLPVDLRLYVSAGRGVRPLDRPAALPRASTDPGSKPPPFQLGILSVGLGALPATAETAELGARYELDDTLVVTTAAWATAVAQEVLFDHAAGTTVAARPSRRLGAEGSLDWRPRRWVRLGADLGAVDARFVDVSGALPDLVGGEPVPGVPVAQGTLRGALDLPGGFTLGARCAALGPRPLRLGEVSPPLALLDAFGAFRWRGLAVDAAVDNLLNTPAAEGAWVFASRWRDDGTASRLPSVHIAPTAPRSVRLGLTVPF